MAKEQGKTVRALKPKRMTGKDRLHYLADTLSEEAADKIANFIQSL